MSDRGDYKGAGEAFVAARSLGSVRVNLTGLDTPLGRQADGTIGFDNRINPNEILGRKLRIVPNDRPTDFEVIVNNIRNGVIFIASNGAMPWWL